MCIICASPEGARQPTVRQIKAMFARNPHGAGYMVARNGKVEIHKGFMELSDLLRQLSHEAFTAQDAVVYHFRVSTQAGVTPAMTHPFPLTSSLSNCEKLDLTCSCGVAHNGIIRMTSTGSRQYSDTALFITRYMTRLIHTQKDLKDPAILEMLEALTASRLAILDKSGYLATVGPFIEDDGLLFSNPSYQESTFRAGNYASFRARNFQGVL